MVPFRREEHSFNSSIPSLSSISSISSHSSSDSQLSYYHVEDEMMRTIDQKNKHHSSGAKRRKRVSFSEYSMLHLIPSIGYYSEKERQSMYLTEEDMERIQEENNRTIEEIRKGNLPDTASECFRGLECKGNNHLCQQKRAMREITISLIISEQEQYDEICPDWIENVYCTITEDSVTRANQMASMDAQSVLNDITVAFTTIKSKLQIDWMQKVGATIMQ